MSDESTLAGRELTSLVKRLELEERESWESLPDLAKVEEEAKPEGETCLDYQLTGGSHSIMQLNKSHLLPLGLADRWIHEPSIMNTRRYIWTPSVVQDIVIE